MNLRKLCWTGTSDPEMNTVLGISGLFGMRGDPHLSESHPAFFHDSAACIVQNMETVAASEEERWNRIKHTNSFPIGAVRSCLTESTTLLSNIDAVSYPFEEGYTNAELFNEYRMDSTSLAVPVRTLIRERLSLVSDAPITNNLVFIPHHVAHARGALMSSGAETALVAVIDGNGERDAFSLFQANDYNLSLIRSYDRGRSLGQYYRWLTQYLGFGLFSEYKVMGLAAYGDPAMFRSMFQESYSLEPDGNYLLSLNRLAELFMESGRWPRRDSEAINKNWADLAAGTQEVLEQVVLHVLKGAQRETKSRVLVLAGGVAQNSRLNGAIVSSGLFEYVYPDFAAHDAGATLGAALEVSRSLGSIETAAIARRRTPFLGGAVESGERLQSVLGAWSSLIEYRELGNGAVATIAERLASGDVAAWAHGRAEFGPRSLGARSILGDPRSSSMRDRINSAIKKREEFRPLAPAVTLEAAEVIFEVSLSTACYDYMGCIASVREDWRHRLQATTHADGTARLQIVRPGDGLFYKLLKAFESLTGIPVLLNTSFNNYAEPIVQGATDALRCFITSDVDFLVIGDIMVERSSALLDRLHDTRPSLTSDLFRSDRESGPVWRLRGVHEVRQITDSAARVLSLADGRKSLHQLGGKVLASEMLDLWGARLIELDSPID